jgi:pimeloyl-ACP methyl ester carboxylesterase
MAMISASDDVLLYAEAHGTGLPVIFSCAYSTTRENWRGQVEPLVDAGFRVLLWDYRGHGMSGEPTDPSGYTLDQVVDDLGSVLEWGAEGEPAVLAGLSFGGLASLHFAYRHPERVRALLLANAGPGFKNAEAAEGWRQRSERTADIIERDGMQAFVSGKAGATCVGRSPELPAALVAAEAIAAQDPSGVAEFGRRVAGLAPSIIDELAEIAVPALVLVGEEDRDYLRAGEVMASKLSAAEHTVLPGAGHIANIECAEAFNSAVVDFLKSL